MESIFGGNGFGILNAFGSTQQAPVPALPQPNVQVDPRPYAGVPKPYQTNTNVLTGDPLSQRVKDISTPMQKKLANQAKFIQSQRPQGFTGSQAFANYGAALKKKYGQVWGNADMENPDLSGGTVKIGPKAVQNIAARQDKLAKADIFAKG